MGCTQSINALSIPVAGENNSNTYPSLCRRGPTVASVWAQNLIYGSVDRIRTPSQKYHSGSNKNDSRAAQVIWNSFDNASGSKNDTVKMDSMLLPSLLRCERSTLFYIFVESSQFKSYNRNFILNEVFLKVKMRRVANKLRGHTRPKQPLNPPIDPPPYQSPMPCDRSEWQQNKLSTGSHAVMGGHDDDDDESDSSESEEEDQTGGLGTSVGVPVFISAYRATDFDENNCNNTNQRASGHGATDGTAASPSPDYRTPSKTYMMKAPSSGRKGKTKNLLNLLYTSSVAHAGVLRNDPMTMSSHVPMSNPNTGAINTGNDGANIATHYNQHSTHDVHHAKISNKKNSKVNDALTSCISTGNLLIAQRMAHCTKQYYNSRHFVSQQGIMTHAFSREQQRQASSGASPSSSTALSFLTSSLRQVEMVGDGNCQFRALCHQLFLSIAFERQTSNTHGIPTHSSHPRSSSGYQSHHHHEKAEMDHLLDVTIPSAHHASVRRRIVTYMSEAANRDAFCLYFDGPAAYDRYLRRMSKSGTWGDELTLKAACNCFNVIIHVLTTEPTHYYLQYKPDGYDTALRRAQAENKDGAEQSVLRNFSHLYLAYISPIHYNSIRFN